VFLGYTQTSEVFRPFESFYVKSRISCNDKFEFIELYSESEKASKIIYAEKTNPDKYEILFENHSKENWYESALCYSKKSDTLYFHVNTSPSIVNGTDVYFDAGLYSFNRQNGTFSKDGMKRYYAVENWVFNQAWNAYVIKGKDYSGFVDFVYTISDSCEKVLIVNKEDGTELKDVAAVQFIYENNLFNSNAADFLGRYLKRIEDGKITDKSAFTLNGKEGLRKSICKNSLYSCSFLETEDGIWIIREHSKPVKKEDASGKTYTVYEYEYLQPFLMEDSKGQLVENQPEGISNIKIYPVDKMDELEKVCINFKGFFVMQDIDGVSYWAFKNGSLIKQNSYAEMISYLEKLINENSARTSGKGWMIYSIIVSVLLLFSIFLIIFICSKQYKKHLSKKDKKLIFNIQDKERSKISRDLHDSVVQTIRAIRTDVEMLEVSDSEVSKKNQIVKELTGAVVLLRNICYNLTPAEIALAEKSGESKSADLELLSVIDTLCKQFSQKTKIPCTINTSSDFKIPLFELEISKYVIRVFQEILTNIEKHSFATSVNILISNELLESQKMTKIVITDDGVGGDINTMMKNKHHFGLRNIVENMNQIDGKVEFYTKPNEGMNIILKVPCGDKNEA